MSEKSDSVKSSEDKHAVDGTTFAVYLPSDVPWGKIEQFLTIVKSMAEGAFQSTESAFVLRSGDVLQTMHDCECCPPHVYFSTSCFHGNHTYCKQETGLIGTKIPACCKFCKAPCVCPCH